MGQIPDSITLYHYIIIFFPFSHHQSLISLQENSNTTIFIPIFKHNYLLLLRNSFFFLFILFLLIFLFFLLFIIIIIIMTLTVIKPAFKFIFIIIAFFFNHFPTIIKIFILVQSTSKSILLSFFSRTNITQFIIKFIF